MGLSERELKLVRLALDKAAGQGEQENAMRMFLASLRARGVDGYSFENETKNRYHYEPPPKKEPDPPKREAPGKYDQWPFNVVFTFGKYRGKELRQIPSDYLEWCLANFDKVARRGLLDAIKLVLMERAGRG